MTSHCPRKCLFSCYCLLLTMASEMRRWCIYRLQNALRCQTAITCSHSIRCKVIVLHSCEFDLISLSLGYHYKRCGASHHHLAFKFELKSADQAIAHGAFEEGLEFAKSSFSLAQTHSELLVLLDVLATALEDMSYNSAPSPLFSLKASCEDGRQFSTSPADILSASSNMGENLSLWEEDKLIKDFSALKREVEQASADKLQSESTAPARHQVIVPNKPASGFLTWQASYTKRKRDEQIITIGVHSSDSMPSLPEEPPASTASQACCTIS